MITSEVPKSISYGPSKGCGGGVIDEMLNQYAAGRLCTYWCVTQERAAGDQGPRHGESYYHAYEFSSVFVVPSLHTRINPLHVLGSYVHNTMVTSLLSFAPKVKTKEIQLLLDTDSWWWCPKYVSQQFSEKPGETILAGPAIPERNPALDANYDTEMSGRETVSAQAWPLFCSLASMPHPRNLPWPSP